MQKNEKASWEEDFLEFVGIEPTQVPEQISGKVLKAIESELHPSVLKVFAKVSFLQFVGGLVTLLFCPQFGISFTSSMGLMPLLMKFGESVCMLGCGALFTGASLLLAAFALKPEEVRVLKEHQVLQLLAVAGFSLGAFICVGAEVVLTLGLLWILGAVVGGAITLEAGWALRRNIAKRAYT